MNSIPAIFQSKRFWSAVFAVLVMVLVNYVPELEPVSANLTEALTVLAVALIGGYTLVDVVSEISPYRAGVAQGVDFAINQLEKAAGKNLVDDKTQAALIAFLRDDAAKG